MLNRTDRSASPARVAVEAYGAVAQFLHWLTAALIFAILPIAWVMTEMAKDNPDREDLFLVHKSIGVTIFALVVLRLVWRATHPAPPLVGRFARWEAFLAKLNYVLLYFILIAMPISGFITSAASNHPVNYFGLFTLPSLPENKPLAHLAGEAHEAMAWVVYAAVALHILAVAWHVSVRRDGALNRMLPKQTTAK